MLNLATAVPLQTSIHLTTPLILRLTTRPQSSPSPQYPAIIVPPEVSNVSSSIETNLVAHLVELFSTSARSSLTSPRTDGFILWIRSLKTASAPMASWSSQNPCSAMEPLCESSPSPVLAATYLSKPNSSSIFGQDISLLTDFNQA